MKKIIFVLLSLFLVTTAVFAQQNTATVRQSELYYVNFPIERIYTHPLGYVVEYRSGTFRTFTTYIPHDWFVGTAGKGEVITLRGGEWPSMTVFYERGEFSHVKLRLRERAHRSWGVLPMGYNLDERFRNVKELRLDF